MKYTAEDILDENYSNDVKVVQEGKPTGTWRWGTCHQTVVRIGGELYAVDYRTQPEEGIQDHSELYPVDAKETIIVEYVRRAAGEPRS